jgi:Uma2 family endonuclease
MSSITTNPSLPSPPAPPASIPVLRDGERLTREEFHRRYEAMPHLKKAELIEGVVHMPSPVRHRRHSTPHFRMINWLGHYVAYTPGLDGGDNGSLKLGPDNEPQPDAYVIVLPEYGGQVLLDDADYIIGAPELIGEVSASSTSYDLHDKLDVYRRKGVKEYVVWRVQDAAVDWFVRRGEQFELLQPGADGILRSELFPGLWLDPKALMANDMPRVFAVVQMGLETPEHAAFCGQLQRCRG